MKQSSGVGTELCLITRRVNLSEGPALFAELLAAPEITKGVITF